MTLRFHCNRGGDEVVLRVSPATLDRAFAATDPELHGSVSAGKVEWMLSRPDGERLQAPIVGAYLLPDRSSSTGTMPMRCARCCRVMDRFPLALALLIIATLITIGVMKMRAGPPYIRERPARDAAGWGVSTAAGDPSTVNAVPVAR